MKIKYSTFILSLIFLFLSISCGMEEKSIFTFTLACSDDLLELVTPIVTFHDYQDNVQTIELFKDDFKKGIGRYGKICVSFNGDSSSILYWQKRIVINTVNISRDMSVKYARKELPSHSNSSNKQYFLMAHKLYSEMTVEVGGFRHYEMDGNIIINDEGKKNFAVIKLEEVEEYLSNLENDSDYCIRPGNRN